MFLFFNDSCLLKCSNWGFKIIIVNKQTVKIKNIKRDYVVVVDICILQCIVKNGLLHFLIKKKNELRGKKTYLY
jgi:hypothetical protein